MFRTCLLSVCVLLAATTGLGAQGRDFSTVTQLYAELGGQ